MTADFTVLVTDAAGQAMAWQAALLREGGGVGGGAFVPGPRLTTEELEAPMASADAGGDGDGVSYEARDAAAAARHAGLGSIASSAGAADAAPAAGGGLQPPSPADFDVLGRSHMHSTVGGSGGGPAVVFDETDLVASGTGLAAEQRRAPQG